MGNGGRVARVIAAACLVNIAVAACSAATHKSARRDRGLSMNEETDGGVGAALDALASAVVDALSGESSAQAGPLPDEVYVEQCSVQSKVGQMDYLLAEHEFLGRSKTDLARVIALSRYANPQGAIAGADRGYDTVAGTVMVQDGKVAVGCGTPSYNLVADVTFILPGR